MKRAVACLIVAALVPSVVAEASSRPKKFTVCSDDERQCLQIIPGQGAGPQAVFRKGPLRGQSFPLVNEVAPLDVLVARSGRIVTFDNWVSAGVGADTVVIYAEDGTLVRRLALDDLLIEKDIKGLSRSGNWIDWRDGARFDETNQVLYLTLKANGRMTDAYKAEVQVDLVTGALRTPKRQLFFYRDPHVVVQTGADVQVAAQPAGSCEVEDRSATHVSSARLLAAVAERVPPTYPPIAIAARVPGTVVVEVFVDSGHGAVRCARALAGPPLLVGVCLDAVRGWRFDFSKDPAAAPIVAGVVLFTFEMRSPDPPPTEPSPRSSPPPPAQ